MNEFISSQPIRRAVNQRQWRTSPDQIKIIIFLLFSRNQDNTNRSWGKLKKSIRLREEWSNKKSWWRWPDKLFKKRKRRDFFFLSVCTPFCLFPTCLENYLEDEAANLFQVFIILTTTRKDEGEKKRKDSVRVGWKWATTRPTSPFLLSFLISISCSPISVAPQSSFSLSCY